MACHSNERKAALLKKLLPPINMPVAALARQENISEATLYQWRNHAKDAGAPVPGDNKLTDEWLAEAKFAVVVPSQIVPRLADQGGYLASESSFYRILRAADQQHKRGRSEPPRHVPVPTSRDGPQSRMALGHHLLAVGDTRPVFYYLYLIEDIYSRKGVGWEVHEQESSEHAAALLQRSVIREQCWKQPQVLHSDNGAPMKSVTLLTKKHDVGVTPSRGRPRVSNDNPYSESLLRTLKYSPQWPSEGFASLDAASGIFWLGITMNTGIAVFASLGNPPENLECS